MLGYRKDLPAPEYPKPTTLAKSGKKTGPVVRDAIGDLFVIDQHEELYCTDVYEGNLREASDYARILRGQDEDENDRFYPRSFETNRLTGCLMTNHAKDIRKRFAATPPGTAEPISRYIRLDLENVSPTLRAGTGADHGSHTAPRPIHPIIPRCITAREAARLHSFPDWFTFHGTRWHDFRQIGNAVPPLLARAVASKVLEALGC